MPQQASHGQLAKVIGHIYDAALEPLRWPTAIAGMCGLVGSFFGSVTAYDANAGTFQFLARWGGDPWWIGELDRKYANMMPFAPVLDRFELGQPFNMSMAAAKLGDTNVWDGPFAREWATPAGVGDSASVILHRADHRLTSLSLATQAERGPVGATELELIGLLAPHVHRALTIGHLIDDRQHQIATLERILDALQMAVVVVDRHCRLFHANRAAIDLLELPSPIASRQGRMIVTGFPETNVALRNAVQRVGESNASGPVQESVPLRIANGRPAIAQVLAVNQGVPWLGAGPGSVAIFVSTPSDEHQPPIDALAGLFGLTTAESRVMRQLARGLNRSEAATELAIADSTVKSHLDHIFLKTGTSSQAELQRLIVGLTTPVL